MIKRLVSLAVLLFAALPALARVISYAPYTNRIAEPGYHERASRRFVLVERTNNSSVPPIGQVVLYDTEGDEPRVVYPKTATSAAIQHVSLYEKTTGGPPLLLVTSGSQSQDRTWFSADGGDTWKELTQFHHTGVRTEPYGLDFGGPWTRGIGNTTRLGNDQWPFIISGNGVWAISATGETKLLSSARGAMAIGQDRTGSRFLILSVDSNGSNAYYDIHIVDLNGSSTRVATNWWRGSLPFGWITSGGAAYIVNDRSEGRFLYLLTDGITVSVAGPRGVRIPSPISRPGNVDGIVSEFFAVPTHDFDGAWILQKGISQATTLSRHTIQRGFEHMWDDDDDVEALIAGASGDKVLIQVHRERDLEFEEERPFVDPALAVWHVGDPPPARYDELYLNEEENKGFVHVDVDRLEEGAPFVFNAGTFEETFEGPTSPPTSGGGDVIQEWGVVRGSLRQRLILPGVARLRGAFASNWLTDVTLANPLGGPQDVDVHYVPLGLAATPETERVITLTLQPYEIRFVPDALHTLFLLENGGGALHFVPRDAINVIGRTYSVAPDGGTYGFGMQAIDALNAAGPRFPVTFSGAFPGDRFRTNILVTDTSGRGLEVGVNGYSVLGATGPGTSITAPAGGIFQLNGLGAAVGGLDRNGGGLVVQPTRGTGIVTVVAIDNRTNDPTYFPPDLSATTPRWIPVIGHVDGANGSHFRSDLYLFNPASETRTVRIDARPWDGGLTENRSFTLLPNEARVITDALPTLFGRTGLARVRYETEEEGEGVRVTSRTYTIDENGATYGSLIPPLNNFQIAANGDMLEILGARGGSGFRTNIGLVELSPGGNGTVRVRVTIVASKVASVDAFDVELPSGRGLQINDVFASRGITDSSGSMIVVQVLSPGLVGAYATLTDNKTNDTTYLGAHLGGTE